MEAPETAGTALKTIIARFTEVKDLTEDEAALLDEDFNFNKIEEALKTVGIQSKDANGQLRDFSGILNDLGPIWDELSTNQQRYIATMAAGSRQQSRFIALMDDWNRTQELIKISTESAGTGTRQMALAMDSIETKTNQLKATWQSFYAEFIDSAAIKELFDSANDLLQILVNIVNLPLGPVLVAGLVIAFIKLIKMGKNFGVNFGKGFKAGWDSIIESDETSKHKAKLTEEFKKGYDEGVAHRKGFELGLDAERTADDIEDGVKNVISNSIGGKNKKDNNNFGFVLGSLLGKSKLAKGLGGIGSGFKNTVSAMGQTAGSQGVLKGLFGTGIATSVKAGTATAVSGGAGATAAGIGAVAAAALPWVLGALAAGAAIMAIVKILRSVENKKAKEQAKDTDSAITRTNEAIKKTTSLTNSYNDALKLQQKGLLRTEEETENYQQTLKSLQEQYPQLVKTLSDGTLELSNTAGVAYDEIISKQREQIATDAEIRKNSAKGALKLGVFNTEEGTQTQEKIKGLVSTYSTYSKDSLKELIGISGIDPQELSNLAGSGLNWETLKEATGSDFTADSYYEFLERYSRDKNTANVGGAGNKQAVALLKQLETDLGLDNIGTFLLDQIKEENIGKSIAIDWAKQFASETQSTFSVKLNEAFGNAYNKEGENAIEEYFSNSNTARQKFEKYLDSINSSLNISEEVSEENVLSMFNLSHAEEIVRDATQEALEERSNLIEKYNDKYAAATGKELSIKEFTNKFSDFSLDQISNYIANISKITQKYGELAGENFETNYEAFYNSIIKGNEQLANSYSQLNMFDSGSIAEYGAQIIQTFHGMGEEYERFMSLVNSSSKILDRDAKNISQVIGDAATDIKNLKTQFEKLEKASEGSLELEDMFTLISESKGALDFSDFTSTANGYQLSQEKIAKTRERMLELQILEYKIAQELNKAQIAELKNEFAKLEISEINLEVFLEQYKVYMETGKKTLEFAEQYRNLLNEGHLSLVTQIYSLERANEGYESIIDYSGKLTYNIDVANTKLGKTISKLEKLIDLLERIDEYSDVDAYANELALDLAHLDFEIEFSSNIDNIIDSTKDKFDTLNELISINTTKALHATQNVALRRAQLEKDFGQYVSFDDKGNLLTNGAKIEAWFKQISDLSGGSEQDQQKAELMEKQLDTLLNQIDAYREEKALIKESASAAEDYLKQIEELTMKQRESLVELEDALRELFIKRDEEIVEALEERYNKMKEMDDEYLDSVREAIDKERQLRDQNKAYEDVAQMERRLALLQMGGGSKVEIQQLQKEIQQARQDIADTEQDNILENIEEENSKRAEAMDDEVEYHKLILEEKKENQILYNQEIAQLLQQDKQTIINTWKALDHEYEVSTQANKELIEAKMSAIVDSGLTAKKLLADDYIAEIEKAYEDVANEVDINITTLESYVSKVSSTKGGVVSNIGQIENAYLKARTELGLLLDAQSRLSGQAGSYSGSAQVNVGNPNVGKDNIPISSNKSIINAIRTTQGKYIQFEGSNALYHEKDVTLSSSGREGSIREGAVGVASENSLLSKININTSGKSYYTMFRDKKTGEALSATMKGFNGVVDGVSEELVNKKYRLYRVKLNSDFKEMAGEGLDSSGYVYINQKDLNQLLGQPIDTQLYKNYRLKYFKTGGLVDYTGPAWVDGTPTKPEAFLSARDTELIASLRDVLGSVFHGTSIPSTTVQKSGDTYYEIHINVDELGDGYSVEDLMEEIEERIVQVAGNNTVVKLK